MKGVNGGSGYTKRCTMAGLQKCSEFTEDATAIKAFYMWQVSSCFSSRFLFEWSKKKEKEIGSCVQLVWIEATDPCSQT